MDLDTEDQQQDDYRRLLLTTCNPYTAFNVSEAIADDVLAPHWNELAEALSLGHNAAAGGILSNALLKYWQREAAKQAGFV